MIVCKVSLSQEIAKTKSPCFVSMWGRKIALENIATLSTNCQKVQNFCICGLGKKNQQNRRAVFCICQSIREIANCKQSSVIVIFWKEIVSLLDKMMKKLWCGKK